MLVWSKAVTNLINSTFPLCKPDQWSTQGSLFRNVQKCLFETASVFQVERHILSGCKSLVVAKPKKSNKCSLKTCRQHGLMPFVCPECNKNHCVRLVIIVKEDQHADYHGFFIFKTFLIFRSQFVEIKGSFNFFLRQIVHKVGENACDCLMILSLDS